MLRAPLAEHDTGRLRRSRRLGARERFRETIETNLTPPPLARVLPPAGGRSNHPSFGDPRVWRS